MMYITGMAVDEIFFVRFKYGLDCMMRNSGNFCMGYTMICQWCSFEATKN